MGPQRPKSFAASPRLPNARAHCAPVYASATPLNFACNAAFASVLSAPAGSVATSASKAARLAPGTPCVSTVPTRNRYSSMRGSR